jgi:hypothetical protein
MEIRTLCADGKVENPDVKPTSGVPSIWRLMGCGRSSVVCLLLMKIKDTGDATRRKKLLRFLESDTPAWKDADHPEMAGGAAASAHRLSQESDKRVLSADELEDNLEKQEPKLKAQIRKSTEEYRSGKKRDAGTFLREYSTQSSTSSRKKSLVNMVRLGSSEESRLVFRRIWGIHSLNTKGQKRYSSPRRWKS